MREGHRVMPMTTENQSPQALPDTALDQLFVSARTHNVWRKQPIEVATLQRLYELARMAPTGANAQPARIVFVESAEAKAKLQSALDPQNVEKTMTAPVTAIIAADTAFHSFMPKLFPARPELKER